MNKIALNLLKIAEMLDDLGFFNLAEQTIDIAEDLLSKADMTPVPSKQPQIQKDPIMMPPHQEKEAYKEFVKDKKKKRKNGIVEGEDVILHQKK